MLDKNTLNDFWDVSLCDRVTYDAHDIIKAVIDSLILNVVGKMHEAVWTNNVLDLLTS